MSRLQRKQTAKMFERGLGYKATSTQLGINRETVRDWYAIWRALGTEGFLERYRGGRRKYPPELKLTVAREHLAGKSTVEIMEQYGISSRHRIKEWTKKYKQFGAAAFGLQDSE